MARLCLRPARALVAFATGAILVGALAQPGMAEPPPELPVFEVGTAVVNINPPRPQYLGGFGQYDPVMTPNDPLEVRAFTIEKGDTALAFAIVDTQGWFSGYQEGDYGITDAREEVGAWLQDHGYPQASSVNVIVSSTHSHAAPTIMGIWGPVDVDYLKQIHDSTIQAIEQAFTNSRPATLWSASADVGTVDGSNVEQTDIYDGWSIDGDLPLLWARDPHNGKTVGLYGNVPIHADIVDGGELGVVSADHIGFERAALDDIFMKEHDEDDPTAAGRAVLAMGTLGRQESIVQVNGFKDAHYVSDFVVSSITHALETAQPVTSDQLGASEQYITVPGTNPLLLVLVAGNAAGSQCTEFSCTIDRSFLPPYQVGGALGTWINVFRVGDIAYVTEPGEAFPEVSEAIRASIPDADVRIVGMAQDQVGYYFPPEDAPHTGVPEVGIPHNSDHLIYNSSLALADANVVAATVAATELGWDAVPVHPQSGMEDPMAFGKPGVQFFPNQPFGKERTITFIVETNAAKDGQASLVGPVSWDFGDGTTGESGHYATHTYDHKGSYDVTATVTDSAGRTRTWTQTVVIE